MHANQTRREWLWQAASAVSGLGLAPRAARAAEAPASPVAIARSKTYHPAELVPAMEKMFDQLGGLGRLVSGQRRLIGLGRHFHFDWFHCSNLTSASD